MAQLKKATITAVTGSSSANKQAKAVSKQRVIKVKPQSMFWLHAGMALLIILSIVLIGWDLIVKFIL